MPMPDGGLDGGRRVVERDGVPARAYILDDQRIYLIVWGCRAHEIGSHGEGFAGRGEHDQRARHVLFRGWIAPGNSLRRRAF